MALDDGDQTRTFTQMGGEGVPFVGMAPFTDIQHVFANMGDGTYTHSGIMAIRQAVASKTRITYKLLVNDAVAMTGGQPAEGGFTVTQYAAQIAAEGVARIAVVADEEDRLPPASALPTGATRHTRAELDAVQRELRGYDGVSVLIYDQVCATEKRRRRKRGKMAQPTRSVVINEQVCENCGDCSAQSSCIAIEPVETSLGRKRRINPTSCNVDLSCLKGFCPSFVTVAGPPQAPDGSALAGARGRVVDGSAAAEAALHGTPLARVVRRYWWRRHRHVGRNPRDGGASGRPGGTHARFHWLGAEERHRRRACPIADDEAALDVVRIPLGTADVMIAADLAVGAGPGVLERNASSAAVVGNLDLAATAAFKHDANLLIDAVLHRRTIERATDAGTSVYLHAVRLAEHLFGNAQAMNTMLLGLAWQRGLVPVGEAAILRAIELNGAAVALNRRAFLWGRILADQPALEDEILVHTLESPPASLDVLIEVRATSLVSYQDRALADRYRALVSEVMAREAQVLGEPARLSRAVAEGLYRLMAYKDEYEVARLHASATYGAKPAFHLSPPLITGIDPATGRRRKVAIPGWLALPLFRACNMASACAARRTRSVRAAA